MDQFLFVKGTSQFYAVIENLKKIIPRAKNKNTLFMYR